MYVHVDWNVSTIKFLHQKLAKGVVPNNCLNRKLNNTATEKEKQTNLCILQIQSQIVKLIMYIYYRLRGN